MHLTETKFIEYGLKRNQLFYQLVCPRHLKSKKQSKQLEKQNKQLTFTMYNQLSIKNRRLEYTLFEKFKKKFKMHYWIPDLH